MTEPSKLHLQRAKSLLALGLVPSDEPRIHAGAAFGDYEILEELGRGSSGVVYRARHAGIHGSVALKLMRDAQLATQHITSALLGPRGRDRGTPADAVRRTEFTFLVHPGLRAGQEYTLASPFSSQLHAVFGPSAPPGKQFSLQYVPPVKVVDYRDAVPGFEGSWLAAFAPVGNTGFVVLVQTRREAMLSWP